MATLKRESLEQFFYKQMIQTGYMFGCGNLRKSFLEAGQLFFTCWLKAFVLMNSTSIATPVSTDQKPGSQCYIYIP